MRKTNYVKIIILILTIFYDPSFYDSSFAVGEFRANQGSRRYDRPGSRCEQEINVYNDYSVNNYYYNSDRLSSPGFHTGNYSSPRYSSQGQGYYYGGSNSLTGRSFAPGFVGSLYNENRGPATGGLNYPNTPTMRKYWGR